MARARLLRCCPRPRIGSATNDVHHDITRTARRSRCIRKAATTAERQADSSHHAARTPPASYAIDRMLQGGAAGGGAGKPRSSRTPSLSRSHPERSEGGHVGTWHLRFAPDDSRRGGSRHGDSRRASYLAPSRCFFPELQLRLGRFQPIQRDLHRPHREPPRVGPRECAARRLPQFAVQRGNGECDGALGGGVVGVGEAEREPAGDELGPRSRLPSRSVSRRRIRWSSPRSLLSSARVWAVRNSACR